MVLPPPAIISRRVKALTRLHDLLDLIRQTHEGFSTARDEPKFDWKELLELQQSLNKILADSLLYGSGGSHQKLDQRIARLEAGSHDKVTHTDVRYVWKDMVSFRVISKRRQDFERVFSRGGDPRSKRECWSWFCTIIMRIAIPLQQQHCKQ